MKLPEILIVGAAPVLLCAYHLWLWFEIRRRPQRTVVGFARAQRAAWVDRVMSRGDGILAVQTLRNWVMATSFLASTAILIAVGLVGFLVSVDKVSRLLHEINLFGDQSDSLVTIKLALLIANFLMAFFNFTLSLRFYNYVALSMNAVDPTGGSDTKDSAIRFLEAGASHYTLGMRSYYFAIPLVAWLFGPIWLLVGVVATIVALYRHDHFSTRRPAR
jgi:uncharacterized membrane protein